MQPNPNAPIAALHDVSGSLVLSVVVGDDLLLTVNEGPLSGKVYTAATKVKNRLTARTTVTVKVEQGTAVAIVDNPAVRERQAETAAKETRLAQFSDLLWGKTLHVTAKDSAGKHFNGTSYEVVDALVWYLDHHWAKIDGVDEHFEFSVTIWAPADSFQLPGERSNANWSITGAITAVDGDRGTASIEVWHFGPSTSPYK
jgi:hypothetical protein